MGSHDYEAEQVARSALGNLEGDPGKPTLLFKPEARKKLMSQLKGSETAGLLSPLRDHLPFCSILDFD